MTTGHFQMWLAKSVKEEKTGPNMHYKQGLFHIKTKLV